MITKPSVLVLGAGASSPYGFPTGQGLSQSIISNLRALSKNESRGKDDWVPFLETNFGIPAEVMHQFAEELRYSRIAVDAFLEHRPEYLQIGKLSIALCLMGHENEEKLFNTQRNWYDYLRLKLDAPFDEFGGNQLSIITFNYDRSIEHYLFMVLQHTYGKSPEQCAEQINKIPIIHVHGRIGALPWQESESRAYEPRLDPEYVKIASDQIIIIISEGNDSSIEFQEAFRLLEGADRGKIFFLGFGYNDTSLKRLRLSNVQHDGGGSTIAKGTAFHVPDSDRHSIKAKWPIELYNNNLDVLEFLENHAFLE